MSRYRRNILAGDFVHVIFRTYNREFLFTHQDDQDLFIQVLKLQKKRFGIRHFAWTGMSNHHHLFTEAPSQWHRETAFARRQITLGIPIQMGDMLRESFSVFSKRFNSKNSREGGLIKDRTKTVKVLSDRHALVLMIYMFLNPVRARMVNHPKDYPYSNFNQYAYGSQTPFQNLFDLHESYLDLADHPHERQQKFRTILDAALLDWARWKWPGASGDHRGGRNLKTKHFNEFLEYSAKWLEKFD